MRISADAIDDDQRPNNDPQAERKLVAKVTVTVKDPSKVASVKDSVDTLMKEFRNMKIQPCSIDGKDSGDKIDSAEVVNVESTMEAPQESTSSQSACQKSCLKSSTDVSTWYIKMKEEIKKEVVEEVLQKLKSTDGCSTSSQSTDNDQVLHEHVFCDSCNEQIRGIRYKCGNCEDFDLCEACEAKGQQNGHDSTHIFLKIRTPSCFFTLREGGKKKIYQVPLSSASAGGILLNKTAFDAKPETSEECFRAKFIRDESFPDGSFVPPGRQFEKIWRVCNSGTKAWTEDTVFHLVWNNEGLKASSNVVAAPRLKSGEEGTVSVSFMAPETFGHFESYWEFHHNGKSFGDTFWCVVRVEPISLRHTTCYPQKSQLHQWMLKNKRKAIDEMRKKKGSRKKEVKQIVEVLNAVSDDPASHRRNRNIRKAVPISQTATPNNTPFDLSPPKSPEPQEFFNIKSEVTVIEDHDADPACIDDAYEVADDKVSITTLSSSDSDSEFVVIPMPKCFSLLESLPSQQIVPTSDPVIVASDVEIPRQKESHPGATFQHISISECKEDELMAEELDLLMEVKKDCDKQFVVSNISLNSSPSSSSISILDSDHVSRPSCPNCSAIQMEESDRGRKDSASQIPDVVSNEDTQEHVEGSSCTFPKFPLSLPTEEPVEPQSERLPAEGTPQKVEEERTIQVLPEGLVTGALLAAATVYNTARAVISNLQPGKHEQGDSCILPESRSMQSLSPAEQLVEMGFCNRTLNEGLLKEHAGDVARVVAELVNLNDNDWYASRHNPTAPPSE